MKKLFVLIVTLVAAVALVGCGEPSGTDASIAETKYTVVFWNKHIHNFYP